MSNKETQIRTLMTAVSEGAKDTAVESMEILLKTISDTLEAYKNAKTVEDLHTVEIQLDGIFSDLDRVRKDVSSHAMFRTASEMVWGEDPLAKLAYEVMQTGKAN